MVLPKYQTFNRRYLASIIDSVIFLPLSIAAFRIDANENASLYIGWTAFHLICWTLYVVIGHGVYGQTLGKRLMGIKVLDISEKHLIGIRKAFLRESVFFFVSVAFLLAAVNNAETNLDQRNNHFGGIVGMVSGLWLILELITMLFNNKRRALHDLLAGSVVVDLNTLKRMELENRQQELMVSLQRK